MSLLLIPRALRRIMTLTLGSLALHSVHVPLILTGMFWGPLPLENRSMPLTIASELKKVHWRLGLVFCLMENVIDNVLVKYFY